MKLLKKQILPELYRSDAFLVSLTCPDGFSVIVSSAGAAVRAVLYPQPDGSLRNIALSFADDSAYAGNSLYAGAVLAPAAGRISNGLLPAAGQSGTHVFQLTKNENGIHTLHGGAQNASFQNWEITETSCSAAEAAVTFSLTLPDGLDGFPGTRRLTAAYRLTPSHALSLMLTAVSDKDTYLNLSSHAYFNLSGQFDRDALDHVLSIPAEKVILNRPDFIPDHISPVPDTPFDFTLPCSLRAQLAAYPRDAQLSSNCGWNHCFVLSTDSSDEIAQAGRGSGGDVPEPGPQMNIHTVTGSCSSVGSRLPTVTCTCPGSGIRLRMTSDAPCMVLYSGGYIENGLPLLAGFSAENPETQKRAPKTVHSVPSCGIAFEFQDYVDAPGGHGFPYRFTPAGETWSRQIRWEFDPDPV